MKLGTHVDSGQMYHVYRNQAAVPLFLHFSISPVFNTEIFRYTFLQNYEARRLKISTHVDSGQVYHVYQNQAAAAYSFLYFLIFLSRQFSTSKFFITLFSGTVRPRGLKLGIHIDSGQMYHVYRNQAAAVPLFLHFSFSPIFNIEIFHHTFLQNYEA